MRKILFLLLIFAIGFCSKEGGEKTEPMVMDTPGLTDEAKKEIIIKKSFKDDNTFVIECKGFPNENLEGKARVESAREAALINAQMCCRDLFPKSVDVIKNGEIKKYTIEDDYVVIQYAVVKKGLKKLIRE